MVGKVIALLGNPYDFTDRDSGERNKGISWRFWLAVVDEVSEAISQVVEFRVKQAHADELVDLGLDFGTDVQVTASGYGRQRGQSVFMEWTVTGLTLLASGERVRLAA